MKVLVTGGAGFIGSNFVTQFVAGKFPEINEIVVLDKLTYAGNKENLRSALLDSRVSFFHGDICDFPLVNELVAEVNAIINFAAESHVDRSIESSTEFIRTNVLGTQTLLDAAKTHSLEVFLQVSTDEVYGSITIGSWDESCPLLPNSPYSASKASADLLVRSYNVTHGLRTVTTRCSNNYGPRQYPEKLIPLFVTRLLNGAKVPVYGTGENIRDWLHVEDHCNAIYIALTEGKSGEIYNIGGGTELSNIALTKKIIELMGMDDDKMEFVADRQGHDQRYSVNWDKIQQLGYAPSRDFDDGLKETIRWISNSIKDPNHER